MNILIAGFDQFSDLSYPFTTQTVITNGFQWSFFAYQLNTIRMNRKLNQPTNQYVYVIELLLIYLNLFRGLCEAKQKTKYLLGNKNYGHTG